MNPVEQGQTMSRALRITLYFDIGIILLFFIDFLSLPRKSRFTAIRSCDTTFSIDYAHPIHLEIILKKGIRNRFRSTIADDVDSEMHSDVPMHNGILIPGKNIIDYRLRIRKRGNHQLRTVYISVFSFFGLCRKVFRIPCETNVRVHPDLKSISKYIILARKSHLGLLGIRRLRRAGGDNDFERLREYQQGDNIRHVDWKASARNDHLIVRTYQINRNQTIIFMLDCGRMMTAENRGQSLLDYSLNASLLLARIALDQGDRVGLIAFAGRVLRYIAPGRGAAHHRKLVQGSYDLFPHYEESNFDRAFQYLNSVCRKRSLVCLISNIIDEMNAEMMESYMGAIAGRHLPFTVLLRYAEIASLLEKPARDKETLFQQAAASDFLMWRREVIEKLKNKGVLTLEALPDNLNANLINEYLRIKARKLL